MTHQPAASNIPDALRYACAQNPEILHPPLALFNPVLGFSLDAKALADIFSYHQNCTLSTDRGAYNTSFVFSTRQPDETLGLLAKASFATSPVGHIIIAQDNKHGADSLEKRIKQAFPDAITLTKSKCRIWILKNQSPNADILAQWQEKSEIQPVMNGEYLSAPGLFSWDRADKASLLLLQHLPQTLSGIGADLGCGYGFLSANLCANPNITTLYSVDNDLRAVQACAHNVKTRNPAFGHHALHLDATTCSLPEKLDFIVMNPPFHTQTDENRHLGQQFCENALKLLKSGGTLYLVANRHLPYEHTLKAKAKSVMQIADKSGFKVLKVQN